MANIIKLKSWDTQLYADCVEFCPFEPYFSLAICGTYQLCESEAVRVGRLTLHLINPEEIDLNPIQIVEAPGILDVKWCRKKLNNQINIAVANALGQLVLYSLNPETNAISQNHVQSVGADRLALSCDWYDGCKIVVSDSSGHVSCFSVSDQGSDLIHTWKAHDYEAWVASFDRHSDQLVYSGGDDSCFRLMDLRDSSHPIFINTKAHQMGVTSIEASPEDTNLLATGSYDERLLLWDKRHMKTWTSETNLGGGVWKLKWEPNSARHLLVASMHNGFHLVDCSSPSAHTQRTTKIVTSYREHSSLAYGCDWSRQLSSKGHRVIASCSFYDHSLHVWTWIP